MFSPCCSAGTSGAVVLSVAAGPGSGSGTFPPQWAERTAVLPPRWQQGFQGDSPLSWLLALQEHLAELQVEATVAIHLASFVSYALSRELNP